MPSYQSFLSAVKAEVKETDVQAVKPLLDDPGRTVLVDIRERDEWTQGYIPGALWISRGFLESKIEDAVPDRDTPVVLYCAGGNRSAFAAKALQQMGYTDVASMAGGFTAWKRSGLPWKMPTVLTPEQSQRYSRHTLLPEIGEAGQIKLMESSALCIGAGGLGSPSSLYLAAAGVGTIGMIDDDVVDASNLQRQILHNLDRVGMAKVDSAEKTLRGLNPDLQVKKFQDRLTSDNVMEVLAPFDVIVDGADNFQTRYLVNDAALKLGKPVVHASIFRFEGQITVFPAEGGPCYRCLYPEPPPPEEAPSCSEAGVLGVLPGIMGVLQATETVKLMLGLGQTLAGRLLVYDALKTKFRELKLRRDPKCPTCGEGVDRSKIELIDYVQFCAGG
ncbi:MAG: molybdopterin-synthase adenylyltransferase MoeB [Kofleriaceae bacterium]|nr:molybdopterin-synthase adenylyltransferase MoeB [Myxococcales bacterium]MCB9563334.1 molybdopterin-synthase adenylyltransferase MoeB [Kofleriaceae bacterium]